jgi:hypothetical protein
MSPKGLRHERLRNMLAYHWTRMAPDNVMIAGESQFNLDVDTFVNPDILVHPMTIHTDKLRGPEALLVVEVAETSLIYDTKIKLPMYASHGVPEYWIINAVTLETTIHRQPLEQTYAVAEEFSVDDRVVPLLVPELAISLKTLRLDRPLNGHRYGAGESPNSIRSVCASLLSLSLPQGILAKHQATLRIVSGCGIRTSSFCKCEFFDAPPMQ